MSFAKKVGRWDEAQRAVGARAAIRFKAAQQIALRQEAKFARKQLIKDIKAGSPGGTRLDRIAPSTRKTRRFRGISGRRPLIATKKFIQAIKVIESGPAIFIGVPIGARDDRGKRIAETISVQERGATIIMPLTPKVMAVIRAIGLRKKGRKTGGLGGGAKVVIIKIKPRPVFDPAMKKYMSAARKAEFRVAASISKILNKRYGFPT